MGFGGTEGRQTKTGERDNEGGSTAVLAGR